MIKTVIGTLLALAVMAALLPAVTLSAAETAAPATPTAAKAEVAPPPASPPVDVTKPVVQPTKIPGKFKLTSQPLPPLESIMKRPTQSLPNYGLYIWCGEYRRLRADLKKVGWKSFRIGGAMTDDDMKMLVEDGVEVMKTIQIDGGADKTRTNRNGYANDEEFLAAYLKTIDAFLTRYGPDGTFFKENADLPKKPIMALEIWNEPNFQYMIPNAEFKADATPEEKKKIGTEVETRREALYAKALPAAFELIKKKWPTVTVVGFGAGGASAGDQRFIQHVLELDPKVAKSFDVLSTHPYVRPVPPETDVVAFFGTYSIAKGLEGIRNNLAKAGAVDKGIWYTELGWPVSKQDGGHFATKPTDVYTTPLLQAAYVVRVYMLSQRLGVDRVHIMFATDTDNFNAGFFLRDGSWRPSAFAVQTLIKMLPNPKFVCAVNDGSDGYYAYQFIADAAAKEPGAPVVMAWNVVGATKVDLPWTAAKATVTDMFGHATTAEAKDGKLTVEVGPCPIYLQEAK